ncbi:MAG: hypothetical protein M1340_06510 [Actinobacteria bacterium]|jgi:hypothetical protein|nr:hypothetical protein [Actinomycetota bacterium]MCL6093471.1 hypothetical protein [Actinomycetota bacterium]
MADIKENRVHLLVQALNAPVVSVAKPLVISDSLIPVEIWNLKSIERLISFDTPLSLGGHRMMLNNQGTYCVTAAHEESLLSCYGVSNGKLVWRRHDLRRIQRIMPAAKDDYFYCCFYDQPSLIVNIIDGQTIDHMGKIAIESIYESPFEQLKVVVYDSRGRKIELIKDGKMVKQIARVTFGVLDVSFCPTGFCISESVGPVRFFDLSGNELWRYQPPERKHVLNLEYSRKNQNFYGTELSLDRSKFTDTLLRFKSDFQEAEVIRKLDTALGTFCSFGEFLVTASGDIINVDDGATVQHIPFFEQR